MNLTLHEGDNGGRYDVEAAVPAVASARVRSTVVSDDEDHGADRNSQRLPSR
jgi:hypothetical protein